MMTDVICDMEDCLYRSKRAMRKYKMRNGSKCYKCTLDNILIIDNATTETDELYDKEFPCCKMYEKEEMLENEKIID